MKAFWKSRVVWVNALALIAVVVQAVSGKAWLTPEIQASILAVLNIILRFDTDTPIGG